MINKQGKKQQDSIEKQEEQLKRIKNKKATNKNIEKEIKLGQVGLLKNNLNDILTTFDMNFPNKGTNIL